MFFIYVDIRKYSSVHIWDIPLSTGPIAFKILLVTEILYVTASLLVKFSLLVFYRRLLSRVQHIRPVLRYSILACEVSVIGVSIAYVFTSIFQCTYVYTVIDPIREF